MQGRVKFFNEEKGFGFVSNEAGAWFFHRTGILGEPAAAGDEVEFWLDDGRKPGELVAVDVQTIPEA